MAAGAYLQSAGSLRRVDALPRSGSMPSLVDRHGNRDEPGAMPLDNPDIVGIEFRSEMLLAKERPVPEMDRKTFAMRCRGLERDLADG